MELMDANLHDVIKRTPHSLTQVHIKCLMKQLLEGLKAIHGIGIFHRDIKPSNILVDRNCHLRIADFGLSRYTEDQNTFGALLSSSRHDTLFEDRGLLSQFLVTKGYRAPELLLSPHEPYYTAIDIWSAGCIMAEMVGHKPLFPGPGHIHQVEQIFKILGLKSVSDLEFAINQPNSLFLESHCLGEGVSLHEMFPSLCDDAVRLLESLLAKNPSKRPDAEAALRSKYFEDALTLFHYEQLRVDPPNAGEFQFESEYCDKEALVALIHSDVESFKELDRDALMLETTNSSIDRDGLLLPLPSPPSSTAGLVDLVAVAAEAAHSRQEESVNHNPFGRRCSQLRRSAFRQGFKPSESISIPSPVGVEDLEKGISLRSMSDKRSEAEAGQGMGVPILEIGRKELLPPVDVDVDVPMGCASTEEEKYLSRAADERRQEEKPRFLNRFQMLDPLRGPENRRPSRRNAFLPPLTSCASLDAVPQFLRNRIALPSLSTMNPQNDATTESTAALFVEARQGASLLHTRTGSNTHTISGPSDQLRRSHPLCSRFPRESTVQQRGGQVRQRMLQMDHWIAFG